MGTTGCCDLRRNMGDSCSTDDGANIDYDPISIIPTSPGIEFPKSLTLASGSKGIIHRSRGHKRTKSAGSNCSRDFSLYTATGLYAHQPATNSDFLLYSSSKVGPHASSELDVNIYGLIVSNHQRNNLEINTNVVSTNEQQYGNFLLICFFQVFLLI